MVLGNQVVDVMVESVCGLICPLTARGSSEIIVTIGLYPRKAANNANVGGICDREVAMWGAPALVIADANAFGRLPVSAPITSVKRSVSPTVLPVFCRVSSIPVAVLRRSGGTVPIMEDTFGEENIPKPMPIKKSETANSGYWKS